LTPNIGFGNTVTWWYNCSSRLSHVYVQYVPLEKCDEMYNNVGVDIDNSMLCAASPGKDACQGDSGGPLYDKENYVLVGVVSFGNGCADENYPGVYANTASEWPWIQKLSVTTMDQIMLPISVKTIPIMSHQTQTLL